MGVSTDIETPMPAALLVYSTCLALSKGCMETYTAPLQKDSQTARSARPPDFKGAVISQQNRRLPSSQDGRGRLLSKSGPGAVTMTSRTIGSGCPHTETSLARPLPSIDLTVYQPYLLLPFPVPIIPGAGLVR